MNKEFKKKYEFADKVANELKARNLFIEAGWQRAKISIVKPNVTDETLGVLRGFFFLGASCINTTFAEMLRRPLGDDPDEEARRDGCIISAIDAELCAFTASVIEEDKRKKAEGNL